VIRPGADRVERAEVPGAPPEILFSAEEERGALRLFLRAIRKLPTDVDWTATVWFADPAAVTSPLQVPRRLRDRVRMAGPADGSEAEHLARATVAVAASSGTSPAPGLLLQALAAGAVPVAARLPQYEELLGEGELGLLFEPRDALTLAAQLGRLVSEPELVSGIGKRLAKSADGLSWARTVDEFEGLYSLIAGRRHALNGNAAVRKRLASRDFIHVDLHMHTDHSPDCATPVSTLLDAARDAASARSRSPTTTRCRARTRRARRPSATAA